MSQEDSQKIVPSPLKDKSKWVFEPEHAFNGIDGFFMNDVAAACAEHSLQFNRELKKFVEKQPNIHKQALVNVYKGIYNCFIKSQSKSFPDAVEVKDEKE